MLKTYIVYPFLLIIFLFHIEVSYSGSQTFYTQHDDAMGIKIKASTLVDEVAMKLAHKTVTIMLQERPDIARRMKNNKAAVAIIPSKSFITVLPEFADMSGKNDSNGNPYNSFNIRGAGGIPRQPVTATSEENLLRAKGDRFGGESVICHEFAHAIMNLGFTGDEKHRWMAIYSNAKRRNLFPKAFAMTHPDEYWAELSQSYFNVNNEINNIAYIKQQDPDAFAFLQSIYGNPSRIQ